jgi:hypothetical protein
MMKQITILVFFIVLLNAFAFGQEIPNPISNKKITKNLLYIDTGSGFFGLSAALNYERTIFSYKGSNISVGGTYGVYSYLIPSGDYCSIAGHYSYGKQQFNLEMALGISVQDKDGRINPFRVKNSEVFPLLYLGCKIKKPTDKVVMKLGVGYPQLISYGFGIAF